MKKKLAFDFIKTLFIMSKTVTLMLGMAFLMILTLYSIVYLKTGTVENVETIDLREYVTSIRMAWLYVSIFTVFVIGVTIEGCLIIYKIAAKIKNTEGDLENKLKVGLGFKKESGE